MASVINTCDICSSQQKSAPAEIRCLECEESLCVDCSKHHAVSKLSRNHNTLFITEYNSIPDFILQIEKHCPQRNEQYTVYCHEHACPACTSCSLEQHKLCSKVSKIEVVVGNSKTSSILTEIGELLCGLSEYIDELQAERKKNVAFLLEQRSQIENDVSIIRQRINEHLDKMQTQVVNDLHRNEQKEREKIESVLQSLSVHKSELEELQNNIVAIKKHASALQAFLAIREIEKQSAEFKEKITNMSEAGSFNNAVLNHEVQTLTYLSSIDFGKIVTAVSPSHVKLKLSKEKQAQLPVDILPSFSTDSVSVKLNRSIDTGCQDIRGCEILPDGRSLFTCYYKHAISCFDKDGKHVYRKRLKSSSAFDIAYSEEMNKIYISSGKGAKQAFIEMNLNGWDIKSLQTDSGNYGTVVKQDKIFYCAENKGLCERNLFDGSVRVIVKDKSLPGWCYIAEHRDMLYYTNYRENSVSCCGIDGRKIWKFVNNVLRCPYGVSVDNNDNVYVVGSISSNVVVLSADGKRYKEILSKKDGLLQPSVVYYQQLTNQLLVANTDRKAFLFDVSLT